MSDDAGTEQAISANTAHWNEIHQEYAKIRADDDQKDQAAAAQFKAETKQIEGALVAAAYQDGSLVRPEVEAARAEMAAVRAIAAKKTQDANGTWAYTKAAAAAYVPDKPFVAAARATEAAAMSKAPSESMSMKPR